MNPDTLFKVTCGIAAIGWIVLIVISPFWFGWDKFVIGIVVVLLALTYTYLNFTNLDPDILQKFSSLKGVANLFSTPAILLAAWVHIMAYDLIGAVWMKRNSVKHGIKHVAILPALVFTCALGPLGFLIYLLTRAIVTKNYFADNGA